MLSMEEPDCHHPNPEDNPNITNKVPIRHYNTA